jgi:hypothetical protein
MRKFSNLLGIIFSLFVATTALACPYELVSAEGTRVGVIDTTTAELSLAPGYQIRQILAKDAGRRDLAFQYWCDDRYQTNNTNSPFCSAVANETGSYVLPKGGKKHLIVEVAADTDINTPVASFSIRDINLDPSQVVDAACRETVEAKSLK